MRAGAVTAPFHLRRASPRSASGLKGLSLAFYPLELLHFECLSISLRLPLLYSRVFCRLSSAAGSWLHMSFPFATLRASALDFRQYLFDFSVCPPSLPILPSVEISLMFSYRIFFFRARPPHLYRRPFSGFYMSSAVLPPLGARFSSTVPCLRRSFFLTR